MRYYKLWDNKEINEPGGSTGAVEIHIDECERYNNLKYAIYWTVNDFDNERRLAKYFCGANFWFIDMDGGDKEGHKLKLQKGLPPTWVIETKNGYHVYWRVDWKNGRAENMESFSEIIKRLVSFYGSDKNAKDPLRLLRVPGYKHWKDHSDPFEIKQVYDAGLDHCYKPKDMLSFYPALVFKTERPKQLDSKGAELFDRIASVSQKDLLLTLSGSSYVNGEQYAFYRTTNDNQNMVVNGKSCSCWIDKEGFIGSSDRGGKTIWQWLRWFGHDNKKIYQIIKEVFPDVV